jgi:hypothetical protein
MKRRAFIPSAPVPLEDRIALSHAGPIQVVAVSSLVRQAKVLDLNGFVLGRDKTVGIVHILSIPSGAMISPLGPARLSGYLLIPSKGTKGKPVTGLVALTDAKGAILLSISGKVDSLGGSLSKFNSGLLTYRIVLGTRAYMGATGQGSVSYGPGPALLSGRFLLVFGNATPPP